jgi:hypothetical protein
MTLQISTWSVLAWYSYLPEYKPVSQNDKANTHVRNEVDPILVFQTIVAATDAIAIKLSFHWPHGTTYC